MSIYHFPPTRRYNTEMGIYAPGCGIDSLMFAWGHDEYMYRMLVANGTTIPKEGLAMVRTLLWFWIGECMWTELNAPTSYPRNTYIKQIRYHSAYPWHDKGEYQRFMAPGDEEMLRWVKEFNKFDLYTKVSRAVRDVTMISLACVSIDLLSTVNIYLKWAGRGQPAGRGGALAVLSSAHRQVPPCGAPPLVNFIYPRVAGGQRWLSNG